MAGGDTTLRHNTIRDLYFQHARSGRMCPEREPEGLLNRPSGSTEPSHRRPADILIPAWPSTSTDALSSGAKAALNFAIINALGPGHIQATAAGSGTEAATAYAQRKRDFENTEDRCLQNGIVLKPVILTAQGGIEPGAQKIGEVIHRTVASETGIALPKVRNAFAIKLSITILRSNARAVRRRDPDGPNAVGRGITEHTLWARTGLATAAVLEIPTETADAGPDTDVDELAADFENL